MPNRSSANDRQEGGDHYKSPLQHWDIVVLCGLDYFVGNITKYLFRYKKKNGLEDLKKARHYLDKLVEVEELRATGKTHELLVRALEIVHKELEDEELKDEESEEKLVTSDANECVVIGCDGRAAQCACASWLCLKHCGCGVAAAWRQRAGVPPPGPPVDLYTPYPWGGQPAPGAGEAAGSTPPTGRQP